MNYKKLYEKQYGEKKLKTAELRKFLGLRSLFKRYDFSRYDVVKSLIEKGEKVLDVGCGEGSFLRRVDDRFEELYGVDISPSRLEEAKKKSPGPNFHFIEANIDDPLPFPNDSFDAIICEAVIEHIYNIFGLVGEMYRVLRSDGYMIAEVPNIAYLERRFKILFGILPRTSGSVNWSEIGWDGGHIHYFTMKKFCWLFEQEGFDVEEKTGAGFLAPLRDWWPSLLCADLIIKARKL